MLKDKKKIQRNREENAKRGWKMSYEGISHISCISILIGVMQTVHKERESQTCTLCIHVDVQNLRGGL